MKYYLSLILLFSVHMQSQDFDGLIEYDDITRAAKANIGGLLDTTFGTHGGVFEMPFFNIANPATKGLMGDLQNFTFSNYFTDIFPFAPSFFSLGREVKVITDAQQRIVITISFFSCLFVARFLGDGTLDTTFGNNGSVITYLPDPLNTSKLSIVVDDKLTPNRLAATSNCIALDQQGRIIIGGYVFSSDRNNVVLSNDALLEGNLVVDGVIARYDYNGKLDTGFGGNGIIRFNPLNKNFFIVNIASDYRGRIVVIGTTENPARPSVGSKFFIARFFQDGSPDSSFGINGYTIQSLHFAPGFSQVVYSLTFDQYNRIFIAGASYDEMLKPPVGKSFGFVACYSESGQLDTSFNKVGFIKNFPSTFSHGINGITSSQLVGPNQILLDTQNRILISGIYRGSNPLQVGGQPFYFIAARYTPDGLIDTTFGGLIIPGVAVFPTQLFINPVALVIDVRSNIYISAPFLLTPFTPSNLFTGGIMAFGTARFKDDGFLDTTYGAKKTGIVITPVTLSEFNNIYTSNMTIDASGRIIMAGLGQFKNQNLYLSMARYTSDYDLMFQS